MRTSSGLPYTGSLRISGSFSILSIDTSTFHFVNVPGSILETGASRALPEFSIGRTAIVMVRIFSIWSYNASVMLYWRDFGPENRTRDMAPTRLVATLQSWTLPLGSAVLDGFRTTGSQINTDKIYCCSAENRIQTVLLAIRYLIYCPTALRGLCLIISINI